MNDENTYAFPGACIQCATVANGLHLQWREHPYCALGDEPSGDLWCQCARCGFSWRVKSAAEMGEWE